MSTSEHLLTYRGEIQAVAGFGSCVRFVTRHRESIPLPIYQLDLESSELTEVALPTTAESLLNHENTSWIGGGEGNLFLVDWQSKKVTTAKVKLDEPIERMVLLEGDRLAAIAGKACYILKRSGAAKPLQSFELDDRGTSLAADPTGRWLVVGTHSGSVYVFADEEQDDAPGEFLLSETDKLHDVAVTALLFEPDELRFFSAGANGKLQLTHARGKLEPEDRGRGGNHSDQVTGIVHVAGERIVTASRDKSLKSWTRKGGTRPATLGDGIPAVVDIATVDIHKRPHLVVGCSDNSLRVVLLENDGRFGPLTQRIYDGYERARRWLKQNDIARRGEALHELADYGDAISMDVIAETVSRDADHGLRQKAAELLAQADHPRVEVLLAPLLKHKDDAIRMIAFQGLLKKVEAGDLSPYRQAIDSGFANVGVESVEQLVALAKKDEPSRQLLISAMAKDPVEIRRSALLALEKVFPKDSPEATLIAARCSEADTRRLALIRCFQRKLLANPRVGGALRRGLEDEDAQVRQMAFLVSLVSKARLAKALRQLDPELHRNLFELESFEMTPSGKQKATDPPKLKASKTKLESGDDQPLLTAMSARALDTCLSGATGLARLGDPRALGMLLQLSREKNGKARAQVCRALASLEDPRALQRLETLIDDKDGSVRDAAFTAFLLIHEKSPLDAARSGLAAEYADVRRRALQVLGSSLKKSKAKKTLEVGRELMLLALNDSDTRVRGEAFKVALNLDIGGDSVATLKFVLNSSYGDVRREVLTLAMGQDSEEWAREMLYDFLNDPHSDNRRDGFDHLVQMTKGKDVSVLERALGSQYVETRKRAIQGLMELRSEEARNALVKAIEDEEAEIRRAALDALIQWNAVDAVRDVMESRYTDVRLQAACARAVFGDHEALQPLLHTATAERPENKSKQDQWKQDVLLALKGMRILGDPQSVTALRGLIHDRQDVEVRRAAAEALASSLSANELDSARELLQHEDEQVRYRIAYGMALCQDAMAAPIVFSQDAERILDEKSLLLAAVALGSQADARLVSYLESDTEWIAKATMLVLLIRDWLGEQRTSPYVFSVLSASSPQQRLAAAKALEAYGDSDAFADALLEFVNDRGDEKPWEIQREDFEPIARLVAHGASSVQSHAISLFENLCREKQDPWDFLLAVFRLRFAKELEASPATTPTVDDSDSQQAERVQLAFGTYVGLVREQGAASRPTEMNQTLAARCAAIRRLTKLSEEHTELRDATVAVFSQATTDPHQIVRILAFEQLGALGVSDSDRAELGIDCGHNDLAIQGLKLLSTSGAKQSLETIEHLVATRDDELAIDCARLLHDMKGAVYAAERSVESPRRSARNIGVLWLSEAADDDKSAMDTLVQATDSRYADVRLNAALALSHKKHKAAFEILRKQLFDADDKRLQKTLTEAIVDLGDPRSSDALLDRVEQDPEKTADSSLLIRSVGILRDTLCVPRLLEMLERKNLSSMVSAALTMVSGYDQRILDEVDDPPERKWMESQHPRHDDVLAQAVQQFFDLGYHSLIPRWIRYMQWALTPAVDETLARLAKHPEDEIRTGVIQAIGWRARYREMDPEPLVSCLEHRDPMSKFLAAEGLAMVGRSEGMSILLSAVELMTDLHFRQRAVLALGYLGDERALDLLLKLLNDNGHALQDTAAEAIGHLGKGEKRKEILTQLKGLVEAEGSAAPRALVGLRWLDAEEGWELMRDLATDGSRYLSELVEQLSYNKDPATEQLFRELLEEHRPHLALEPARRLFGLDSLEPDYAALSFCHGYSYYSQDDSFHCLARVCERGDPVRIFAILPKVDDETYERLTTNLVQREEQPVDAVAKALDAEDAKSVRAAATVAGYIGEKSLTSRLGSAIAKWIDKWFERRKELQNRSYYDEDDLLPYTAALNRLCWAAGKLKTAKKELLSVVSTTAEGAFGSSRIAALHALHHVKLAKADWSTIRDAMTDPDADVRRSAVELMLRFQASELVGVENLMDDRVTIGEAVKQDAAAWKEPLEEAAGDPNYQAVAIEQLVKQKEVKPLVEVAKDGSLRETVRLGAIEALSTIDDRAPGDQLAEIGQDASFPEELRKAAWRGLRRWKRRMDAQAKSAGEG